MADVTVAQFAEVLKVPVEKLLVQLDQAGIKVAGPTDKISDEAKLELLSHLRRSHGQSGEEAGAVAAPAGEPARAAASTVSSRRAFFCRDSSLIFCAVGLACCCTQPATRHAS